ncbi:PREDICTED: pleckstrin homology-like domain family B member 1 [Rhagoletis zephyria]|uniref:pleckstrin homology-like domain family B member 1 n=1 Tax=Rhagoletis zephyria TaxID=28612 RepID=UPI000811A78A|nr:PREDICTED: pleckstrin homology-like domain family B member 1 [Rhagoletis zephyria]
MTIGSASSCSISLNGSGVRPIHCTIYRSEENEVTIVPEHDARILIDGTKITHETNLTQGAMITIGNSNYLRFNNPAEAQMMRSAMGSNERISMPQIDFTQVPRRDSTKSLSSSSGSADARQSLAINSFYEEHISPITNAQMPMSMGRECTKSIFGSSKSLYNNVATAPIDINGLHCPKVFTADLVTVNMPAKDVLGQKYANFAKNLAENHRNDKNSSPVRNNQLNNSLKGNGQNGTGNYVNVPSTSNFIQNTSTNLNGSGEFLAKVNNTTPLRSASGVHHHNVPAYDRYPKPGTYGGLQIYPMNGLNTEINSSSANSSPLHRLQYESSPSMQRRNLSSLSSSENERLEDMLKICTEYSDRQNQSCAASLTSSPIVQNRIKTNGSLPRDKKSPFYHDLSGSQLQQSFSGSSGNLNTKAHNGSISSSTGYENVRLVGQNRVEIGGQTQGPSSPKTGYENVVMGKYVPQSPRTKIRTTCMSPKKDHSFSNAYGQAPIAAVPPPVAPKPPKQSEYEQLIKTFEEKLKLEMQAIEESCRYQPRSAVKTASVSADHSPAKRTNKNINNLTLNLHESNSLQNSPRLQKKPAPAPRMFSKTALMSFNNAGATKSSNFTDNGISLPKTAAAAELKPILGDCEDIEKLKQTRKQLLMRVQELKNEISELQKMEAEELRELDMEKALVTAEVHSVGDSVGELETQLELLQNKIHRFEAQRNATRVMEENQQAKLKQSIEMKQDQAKKLKSMLQQKPSNDCLKEELHNVSESLENDRKTFEDLEFQYLEEESEWHAYREELHNEEANLSAKIKEKRIELQHLEGQDLGNPSMHAKTLKSKLVNACNLLKMEQERLTAIESSICDITGELKVDTSEEDVSTASSSSPMLHNNLAAGVMSQSLFGSAELLCPKRSSADIMSKSVNENMFFNNKIELPAQAPVTSTPKRKQLYVVDIDDADLPCKSLDARHTTECADTDPVQFDKSDTQNDGQHSERVKFNLSLGNDDFEVNPLERRVPSQDDIDRICKVTSSAPISTKGASTRIFDSIKEIERNRQLLLAQQGHHVIEHERQKIIDLKKKCHDEARAQYLLKLNNGESDKNGSDSPVNANQSEMRELQRLESGEATACIAKENIRDVNLSQKRKSIMGNGKEVSAKSGVSESLSNKPVDKTSQQRHSQPEFVETQIRHSRSSPRPLSEANSELSCDLLDSDHKGTCKSNYELSTASPNAAASAGNNSYSTEPVTSGDEAANKRSSVNSNETTSGVSATGSGSVSAQGGERKRALPKHQRPLTRYLPIFSPDLNLRHHIESAGHQITLCPHVFVDAFSCRGYLHKLGATFHGWARRWFVLDRQRSAFIYYADKSERKPRGGAYFSTIDEVYLDHLNASKSGRPHCTFIVKTKKRSYHLQAASDAAARIWIDAIITGAQGNLDY